MKRQNYLPTSATARARLARPPLPFTLPSIRRESGAKLASGGIAAAGAKWASPRVSDSDDRAHAAHPHDKPEEPSSTPKAAWGGAGLRPSRPTSDFPNLGPSQTTSVPDPACVTHARSAYATHSSDDARLSDHNPPHRIAPPFNDMSAAPPPQAAIPPHAESHPSPVSQGQPINSSANQPPKVAAATAFPNNDDDDDDWCDDSQAMDFLSDPVPLADISFPDMPPSDNNPATSQSSVLTPTPSQPSPTASPSRRSMFPPPLSTSPSQFQSRQPQILHPPAAHWAVHNHHPSQHPRGQSNFSAPASSSKSSPSRPSMFPDRRAHHPAPALKNPNVPKDLDLKVIEDQKSIMKTKAESAQEARKRQDEQRERDQKERSARKLKELEERLRKKKEQEAAAAAPPPPPVQRDVTSAAELANGVVDIAISNASPGTVRNLPPSPRVVLRRPKQELGPRRDGPSYDRSGPQQRPTPPYPTVNNPRQRNHPPHHTQHGGRLGSQGPPGARHRRSTGPIREYDGPASNETRDQWLERRRKKTETRNAVRSIIDLMITRAVNGGHAAPKHMHHRHGPPGVGYLQRRDHGRRGLPHGMRPSPGRDQHVMDRARRGPPRRGGPPFSNSPRPAGRPVDGSAPSPSRHNPPLRAEVLPLDAAPRHALPVQDQLPIRESPSKREGSSTADSTTDKRAPPPPMRPAPWAPKPHGPPMHPTGMSPMAALRAQEAAAAAQRANTARGEVSRPDSIGASVAGTESSSTDQIVSPLKSRITMPSTPQGKATPGMSTSNLHASPSQLQRTLPSPSGLENSSHPTASRVEGSNVMSPQSRSVDPSVHAQMKSTSAPSSAGENVKVLMNPNARREPIRDMQGIGRGAGPISSNTRPGYHPTDIGRGRGGSHRRRGGKADFGRRERRDIRKNEHSFPSGEQNVSDASLERQERDSYGPSLATPLAIVHDEKEESKAWANASNGPAPPTSFDAITRAFSNQPAPFALVGAPMIPPVPVVAEISSSAEAKPSGPFDNKHEAWGSGSSGTWSGRTSESKGVSEWWKSGTDGGAGSSSIVGPDLKSPSSLSDPKVAQHAGQPERTYPSGNDRVLPVSGRNRPPGDVHPSRDDLGGRGGGRRLPRTARKVRRGQSSRDGGGNILSRDRPVGPDGDVASSTTIPGNDHDHNRELGKTTEGQDVSSPVAQENAHGGGDQVPMGGAAGENLQAEGPGNGAPASPSGASADSKSVASNSLRRGAGPPRVRGRRGAGKSRRREGIRDPSLRRDNVRNDAATMARTHDAGASNRRSDGRRQDHRELRSDVAGEDCNTAPAHSRGNEREGYTREEKSTAGSRGNASNESNREDTAASESKRSVSVERQASSSQNVEGRNTAVAERGDISVPREGDGGGEENGDSATTDRDRGKGRGRPGRGRRGRGNRWRGRGGRGRGRGSVGGSSGTDADTTALNFTVANGAVTANN